MFGSGCGILGRMMFIKEVVCAIPLLLRLDLVVCDEVVAGIISRALLELHVVIDTRLHNASATWVFVLSGVSSHLECQTSRVYYRVHYISSYVHQREVYSPFILSSIVASLGLNLIYFIVSTIAVLSFCSLLVIFLPRRSYGYL